MRYFFLDNHQKFTIILKFAFRLELCLRICCRIFVMDESAGASYFEDSVSTERGNGLISDKEEAEADALLAELLQAKNQRVQGLNKISSKRLSESSSDSDTDEVIKNNDSIGKSNPEGQQKWSHTGTGWICKICCHSFVSSVKLNNHLAVVHPRGNDKRFICGHCGKGFNRGHHYRNHVATHGEKAFVCDKCPSRFRMEDSLKIHKARDHKLEMDGTPAEKTFPCSQCHAVLSSFIELRNHGYSHKQRSKVDSARLPQMSIEKKKEVVKELSCSMCSSVYKSRNALTRHMRQKHAEEHKITQESKRQNYSFVCKVCSKRLKSIQYLKWHYQRHASNLPFKCQFCDKAYPNNNELKKHVAKHAKLKVDAELEEGVKEPLDSAFSSSRSSVDTPTITTSTASLDSIDFQSAFSML